MLEWVPASTIEDTVELPEFVWFFFNLVFFI
jgi:hypothetical protein